MTEYTKREDAINSVINDNLVGGKELFEKCRSEVCVTEWFDCLRDCVSTLETVPSADVVEVVRCKDCKHYKGLAECEVIGDCMGTYGFCAWGERKDNETD